MAGSSPSFWLLEKLMVTGPASAVTKAVEMLRAVSSQQRQEVSAGLHAFLCASRADEAGPVARLRALVTVSVERGEPVVSLVGTPEAVDAAVQELKDLEASCSSTQLYGEHDLVCDRVESGVVLTAKAGGVLVSGWRAAVAARVTELTKPPVSL